MTAARGDNLVLIGMPGAGKSTLGVLLAKRTARDFVDTDVLLQARAGRSLQAILDADGIDAFRRIEEETVLSLQCRNTVIATGGSVVYGEAGMRHLRAAGVIIYLDVPLAVLEERLQDLPERGVVGLAGRRFAELYAEREPLYRRWADVRVACGGSGHGGTIARVLAALGR